MSVSKYEVFIKVAELHNLSKAAEALDYSQPAVSHIINSLETRFGFPLFYRNRNQCILTENGKLLLEQCREAVKAEAQVEETALALNGLMTGTLRIGSVNSMPSGISFTPLFRDPVLLILPCGSYFLPL